MTAIITIMLSLSLVMVVFENLRFRRSEKSLKSIIKSLESIIKSKDEIIAAQDQTIGHLKKSIETQRNTIDRLNEALFPLDYE